MAGAHLLIVEDEPEIANLIRFNVEREQFTAEIVGSGTAALRSIESKFPDLVILDLMLPDLDGLEVCRRMRSKDASRDIPIVMVSAKGEEADIVTGIELGADDYVTKPFSPKVLIARIRNVLRRRTMDRAGTTGGGPGSEPGKATSASDPRSRMTLGGGAVVIDSDRHTVTAEGENIDLTVTEFGILRFLALRPGFVRTRDQIISAVHGGHTVLSRRTVDVHMTALRRKLGAWGQLIETVRGVGYRMADRLPADPVDSA